MKILKIAAIALIVAATGFSTKADAQVIVKARIGSGHVYHRQPVRRVYHRPYHRHYRAYHRGPAYHHRGYRRY